MAKRNVWVEKMSLIDAAVLFFASLFCKINIRYDEYHASTAAVYLLELLKRLHFTLCFYPAGLSLDKKDSYGYAVNYKLSDSIDACAGSFCDEYLSDRVDLYKKAAKSFISFHLFNRFTFITMVEAEPNFKAECDSIYLSWHPLNNVVNAFYRKKYYLIKESFVSQEGIKYKLRPVYHLLMVLFSRINPRKAETNILDIKPSVWVEYCHVEHLDFSFWGRYLDRSEFDIVYYLDRGEHFPLSEMAGEIEKRGFSWVNLPFVSLAKYAKLKTFEIKELLRAFFCSHKEPLKEFKFDYRLWLYLYREIFKRFKVKVLIQHQEASWIQGAQAEALESVGGIMIGFHWSIYQYYKEPIYLNPQHVYFVWGKSIHDCMLRRGDVCKYILPSGLWLINDEKHEAMRGDFYNKTTFRITIFDSSVAYNIYQSPETLSEFYLNILNMLLDNTQWSVIVKSKNYDLNELIFLPEGIEIEAKISLLIKQGRLLFLKHNFSPVKAASYSDLCVCYGMNSAGIIAGIHGYRAVHWDCSGWLHHPFYKDSSQQFMYTGLKEFKESILKASQGDKTIGDFSSWRKRYNYFDDFKASRRVGEFIASFMKKNCLAEDCKIALRATVDDYVERNIVKEDFFSHDECWGDIGPSELSLPAHKEGDVYV